VGTFFEASRRHDGEIDCTAQVDQIGVGLILDLDLFDFFVVFVLAAAHIRAVFVVFVASIGLSKNLGPELFVCFLVCFPICVELEDVETILYLNLVIEASVVGDLILLFNKIQLFLDRGIVLVAILSDLEQDLDHVLRSLVNVGFV
jgi:hypothetical protein